MDVISALACMRFHFVYDLIVHFCAGIIYRKYRCETPI